MMFCNRITGQSQLLKKTGCISINIRHSFHDQTVPVTKEQRNDVKATQLYI